MVKELQFMLFKNLAKFNIPEETEIINDESMARALTVNANLVQTGLVLDKDCIMRLASLSKEECVKVYNDIIAMYVKYTGYKSFDNSKCFYPNFPEEVMNKDEASLYFNSLIYYAATYGLGMGNEIIEHLDVDKEEKPRHRFLEFGNRQPKIISYGDEKDLEKLMINRVYSMSMSPDKYIELKEYCKITNNVPYEESRTFASKENLTRVAYLFYLQKDEASKEKAKALLKDTPDVLRFIALVSNERLIEKTIGNNYFEINPLTLSSKTKNFKINLSASDKRFIKECLNNCKNLYYDVWKHKDLWKKTMRYIGPDKKTKTPIRVIKVFDNLVHNNKVNENGEPILSAFYEIKKAIEYLTNDNDISGCSEIAKKYPGLYINNLASFIRAVVVSTHDEKDKEISYSNIMKLCKDAIKNSNTPIIKLLQTKEVIEKKDTFELNIYKNTKNTTFVKANETPVIIPDKIKEFVISNLNQFIEEAVRNTKELGSVYIDPELVNNKVPMRGERNASDQAVLTPYSTFDGNKDKNLLMFGINWSSISDKTEHIDIDLSVAALDKNLVQVDRLSYYELRANWGCHSGDFTATVPGDGVREVIICDKEKMKEAGIKYLVPMVHGFNVPFNEANNVKFIRMEREGQINVDLDAGKGRFNDYETNDISYPTFNGEVIELSTIEDPIKLNAPTNSEMPMIYDVDKDKYTWLDSKDIFKGIFNVDNDVQVLTTQAKIYQLDHNFIPNMYDLFTVYAQSNGQIVDDITKADTVFLSKDQDLAELNLKENAKVIFAKELDTVSAEYCAKQKILDDLNIERTLESDIDTDFEPEIKEVLVNIEENKINEYFENMSLDEKMNAIWKELQEQKKSKQLKDGNRGSEPREHFLEER